MKKLHTAPRLLCVALATAFPLTALAEEDLERLTKPTSSVTLGVGHVSTDNQRFGMYNGMSEENTHLIGEASILRRNDANGTWLRLEARNLGLPSRELRIEHEKQGDWGYSLDYTQIPRVTPYDVHTALQGIGSNSLSYPQRSGATTAAMNALQPASTSGESEIRTDRYKTTLGFMKFLNPQLEFAARFQSEEKRGERIFGRGTTGTPAAQEFLAEPIDTTTHQLDMTLSYLGEKLQLTGGYYGSFFANQNSALSIAGGAGGAGTTPATGASAGGLYQFGLMALPPDNHAHQLYVNGAYDFTRTTRATFKYSYARAEQNDSFILAPRCISPLPATQSVPNQPTNDSCRSNLGGRLDTTLVQAGVTSRPVKDLSLLANIRYEDRDEKTPVSQYIRVVTTTTGTAPNLNGGSGNSTDGFNEPRSLTTLNGKLEASYQLAGGYRLTGGVDYEDKKRSINGVRIVGYRAETEELSYRAELKRSLFDALTGTVGYTLSNRKGSNFRELVYLADPDGDTTVTPNVPPGGSRLYANTGGYLQPIYIADRDRHKFKLLTDWTPMDALSLQFAFEDSRDSYDDRDKFSRELGVRSGSSQLYSVDASYAINDNWRVHGYAAEFTTEIAQAASTANTAATYWTAAMKNANTNYGFGVTGKIGGKFSIGADVLWAEDHNTYHFGGAATSLPDINWQQTTVKLFGTYAYDKNTTLRLDYVHDRRETNDWTWNRYVYTDGTWLEQKPLEKVHFLGASVQYSFR